MPATCTVLIVDDHTDSRELLTDYLTMSGFTVASAANGADALARARELKPHVVLMDLSLPGTMDGWEAIRRIKSSRDIGDTTVVVITGWANRPAHERAVRAGASAVIVKPVDLPALVEQINQLCTTPVDVTST
jgi:CheY-like chemotaxis protein